MQRVSVIKIFMLLAVLAWSTNSAAQTTSKENGHFTEWRFTVAPYLWAAGLEGETGTLPGLPPADVNDSFSDIVDDIETAGMIVFSGKKGQYGISGDIQYVETTTKDNSLAPLFSREKVISKSFIATLLGNYAIAAKGRSNLKLSGGARLWSVETELALSSGILQGQTLKGDDVWVDPVVGASGNLELGAGMYLTGWTFIGGFGAGSEIMADVFGGIGYRFGEAMGATIGYRWMKVNRDDDDFLYDVVQKGLVAGLTFEF